MRNLTLSGYMGRVTPVNPKGGVIQGIPAAASLREVDPPADVVAILVKPESILDVVQDGIATGHKNFLILPGGFAEAGPEGLARDAALRALARDNDLLIVGPNCAGLASLLDNEHRFAATFFRDVPRGGPVAFISQSGAIAEEMIAASHGFGIPLGAVVSVGNAMHLDVADYVEYFGHDPACKAIILYVESFGDPDRFLEATRSVALSKPIVALVGGRTQAGRSAAFRHTGSQPWSDAETDAFCVEAGVLRVTNMRQLRLAGKVFATHPKGIGERVLILSNSGGPGVLAADQAAVEGLELVELPDSLQKRLREALPPEAAVANPIDLLADAREDRFSAALSAVLEEMRDLVDAVLMIHVVPFMVNAEPVVYTLADFGKLSRTPIMHSMMGTIEKKAEWFMALAKAGVPTFNDTEEMCVAAGMLARYRHMRATLQLSVGSSGR